MFLAGDSPTETSMPASLKISKVGLVTKPEPLGCYQRVDRLLYWSIALTA